MTDDPKTIFQREELYRTIIETAHDLIWILDTQGNYIFYNRRCEEASGYELSGLTGNSFASLIHPGDLQKVKDIFIKTLQGEPQTYDVRAFDKNGRLFVLSVNTVPFYEKDKIIGTMSFGRDITEQKRMEELLRESEERYRRLVEFSPEGIIVHNLREIVFANAAGAKILGAACPEELIGIPLSQIIHPDYREIVRERIRMEEEGKAVPLLEEKFIRLDGTTIDVEVVAIPYTHQGKMEIHSVIRDITERKRMEESLRESEERYRRLVEFSPEGIIVHNLREIIFTNAAGAKILGAACPEELIGIPLSQIIHPDYREIVRERIRMEEEGKAVPLLEEKFIRLDGTTIDVEVVAIPCTHQGKLEVHSVIRDITERKRMEESLRESEERYRMLAEFSPYGLAIHSERKFVYVNLAATKIFDAVNPEEIIGKPIMDFIHPDYHEIVRDRIRMEEEGKVAPIIEEKFLRLDGTPVDVEIVSIPFPYKGKKAMYGIFQDITERKRAKEALRESETRYRDLVEHARDIIFTISSDGKTISLNPAFETCTGWSSSEWLGRSFRPLIHPDDLPHARDIYQQTISGEIPSSSFELRILHSSGNYISMELTITSLIHDGKVESILGIARDITERKKLEEVRLENERLLIASRAKSEFIATVSHELRTPLTSIIGFSELFKDKNIAGELNDKQEYFVDKVLANSNHLLQLVDDILDLSKIEAEKLELVIENFSVPDIIEEAVTLIREMAVKRNITIERELISLNIEADKKRFKQILLNLLSNAVKFSKPEGGIVTINAKKSGDMAQISVSDTGIGIKEEDIGRLFWAFEQLDSGITRKYGGTGLGLAISKRLVELHGGMIEVKSSFGEGSTVTFSLPLKAKKREN